MRVEIWMSAGNHTIQLLLSLALLADMLLCSDRNTSVSSDQHI